MKNYMLSVVEKYVNFITNIKYDYENFKVVVPKKWNIMRTIIHWITLPIKLMAIALIVVFDILYQLAFHHIKITASAPSIIKFNNLLNKLPIWHMDFYTDIYVNRVPLDKTPNGKNHNIDHQAARHGVYLFLLNRLKLPIYKARMGVSKHLFAHYVCCRGFNTETYNFSDVSGEQFLNLLFGLHEMSLRSSIHETEREDYLLNEFLERSIYHFIRNDYSLLNEDFTKSKRGMFQPGLETVGAQSLVSLAILRFGIKKLNLYDVIPYYKKLLWGYGYGLLSLFPTAWLPFKRNQSNDVNCMTAAYMLAKMSDTKLAKFYWTIVMFNIWLLSFKSYNGYITGMFNEVAPWLLSKSYIKKCQYHLYESNLNGVGFYKFKSNNPFVKNSEWIDGEFLPEEGINDYADGERTPYHSGLGALATLVLIDPISTKTLMEELNGKQTV